MTARNMELGEPVRVIEVKPLELPIPLDPPVVEPVPELEPVEAPAR